MFNAIYLSVILPPHSSLFSSVCMCVHVRMYTCTWYSLPVKVKGKLWSGLCPSTTLSGDKTEVGKLNASKHFTAKLPSLASPLFYLAQC